jgi:tripartite-type tricarboxylate transporter receptor subunit TctC
LPDVPTVAESGFAGFDAITWSGLVAPAGTPDTVIGRLNAQAATALRQPEMAERLALDGSEPFPSGVAQFAEFVRMEHAKWGAIVRDTGMRID